MIYRVLLTSSDLFEIRDMAQQRINSCRYILKLKRQTPQQIEAAKAQLKRSRELLTCLRKKSKV